MQQLRDKLAITERTAKSEAQLKVPSEDQISCSFVVISIDREFFRFPSSIFFYVSDYFKLELLRKSINCGLKY